MLVMKVFCFSTLPDLVVDALDQEPPIQRESVVREDEGGRENSEEISSSQEGDQQRRFRSIQDLYDETDPVSYGMDVCLSSREEPTTYLEASKDQVWVKAMKEELDAIEKSATWELIMPPIECRPIGLKWVFKIKKNSRGEVTRHKLVWWQKATPKGMGLTMKKCLLLLLDLNLFEC